MVSPLGISLKSVWCSSCKEFVSIRGKHLKSELRNEQSFELNEIKFKFYCNIVSNLPLEGIVLAVAISPKSTSVSVKTSMMKGAVQSQMG